MSEETKTAVAENPKPAPKKEKKPALEDKPFAEFITDDFLPALESALTNQGIPEIKLSFVQKPLPSLTGAREQDQCWQIIGNWAQTKRQFNLYFLEENINGPKAFSYSVFGKAPSTIESFMIDERKVTLDLMVLYTIQRLNSQKWLTGN